MGGKCKKYEKIFQKASCIFVEKALLDLCRFYKLFINFEQMQTALTKLDR
jgi:hypothetical protein